MDDTLFREKEYVLSGFKAVARRLGEKQLLAEGEAYVSLLEAFVLDGRGRTIDVMLKRHGLDVSLRNELIETYRTHLPDISLRKDVSEFLAKLAKRYRLCLITNGWKIPQELKVKSLGLEEYFDLVLFSQEDGLEYAKPHERYFLKALDRFDVQASEVLVVGDSGECDIRGGERLSMKTFLVRNTLSVEEQKAIEAMLHENS